jgi:hypothetical protein
MINEEKLKMFLYVLMRDTVVPGEIERIMRGHLEAPLSTSLSIKAVGEFKPGQFSNKYLEAHVMDIISRFSDEEKK